MIWNPEKRLCDRVKRLRDEYFSFRERDHFRNEVRAYTTGTAWDRVFCPHNWTVVPEMFPFLVAFEDCLAACAEGVPLPDGFFELPLIERRAAFFAKVIERQLPVQILEGELIVGGQFSTALSLCLTKKEAASYDCRENEFLEKVRELDAQGVGNCGAVPGHIIPDYPRVLRLGMRGMVAEIEKLGSDATRRSFVRTAKAARNFAGRYAESARRLSESTENPTRVSELKRLAEICDKVPWEPAGTFYEALQSLWFTHMLVMAAESYPGAGLSHGRIDQYLYPFYRADIEAGRLTRDGAKELLECFWIKHNYAYDYQGRVGNNQGINSSFGQLITLGGIDADGHDASNELTWLMLEVIEEINLIEPKPNIRLHADTPPDLMNRVAALVARSQGSPFLLNFDESSMRGLAWQGLPEDRLWDYAPVGCLENTLQGCDRSGTVDVNFNLAKAVELALFNGRELAGGKQIGPRTGSSVGFAGFDDFYQAFCVQLTAQLERIIAVNNLADGIRAGFAPTPFLSLLVGGCAEQGKDITSGGALYNFITVEGVALATTVDSLLSVKHLVYEERRVELTELLEAIAANFEGHEKLRLLLANKAPRYGNDDQRADELARQVSTFWTTKVVEKTSPATGRRYRGGYLSWNYWVSYAPKTAATPDGRKRGTYLSNGTCPVTGRDRLGPTANARSVAGLGLESAPNGDSHTITLSPSLVRDDEHIDKLAAFLRAYAEQGGTALQVNIIDSETLRRAQREPCEYGNLLVRVTGYNAYFVTLGREIQDEIISRLCHAV